jgi:methyl-accepting chemotaxis protein
MQESQILKRWFLPGLSFLGIGLLVLDLILIRLYGVRENIELLFTASAIAILAIGTLSINLYFHQRKLRSINHFIHNLNNQYILQSDEMVVDSHDTELLKSRLTSNLQQVADFIRGISKGNYDITWQGLDENTSSQKEGRIAYELIAMREQMKIAKEEDSNRLWLTEGLNKFSDLIRAHQSEPNLLFDNIISSAVNYVDAKVGGIFLSEEHSGEKILKLKACYAYNRKKFLDREIEIGHGLISECYLSGEACYLKEIPKNYISITSGLGEATPSALLLIPLKTNDEVEGVMEIASLEEFKPHYINFLKGLSELLGATIRSIRTSESTKELLAISQSQAEEMRSQEEEMRQNMEELEATQEEMARQMKELHVLKADLEKERYLFAALMDNIPDAIYFKDKDCKLIRVSQHMAKAFNLPVDQLVGKSDFDFQDEAHAREAFNDEQRIMKSKEPMVDFVEREILADGTENWISSTKMPLYNINSEVVGTFGISRNITNYKKIEQELELCRNEYKILKRELGLGRGEEQNANQHR